MSWARALASSLCCSGHESAVPLGTKPALIKTNSIAQRMENGPHYYYRLEVKFLWDRPIGGNVDNICIHSRSSLSTLNTVDVFLLGFPLIGGLMSSEYGESLSQV